MSDNIKGQPDPECKHEPDMAAATIDCDSAYGEGRVYVDVPCKHCGASGCLGALEAKDVQWPED